MLENVLNYKNDDLLKRYRQDYPNNKLSAEAALTELLKFFWLSDLRRQQALENPNDESLQFHCAMHREMREIDDMWHVFLLFTQEYMNFSEKYFGYYIHHAPNTAGGNPEGEAYESELTKYLSYIYDHLGEKTLRNWFADTLAGETI